MCFDTVNYAKLFFEAHCQIQKFGWLMLVNSCQSKTGLYMRSKTTDRGQIIPSGVIVPSLIAINKLRKPWAVASNHGPSLTDSLTIFYGFPMVLLQFSMAFRTPSILYAICYMLPCSPSILHGIFSMWACSPHHHANPKGFDTFWHGHLHYIILSPPNFQEKVGSQKCKLRTMVMGSIHTIMFITSSCQPQLMYLRAWA